MTQMQLWAGDLPANSRIVNVAQVPQRSPLRYPGGKTWFVPRIREWLKSLRGKPRRFIEPFAGGGIIGLTVAFEDLADEVIMVELDKDVAALWQTILSDDNEWLADQIVSFDLSLDSLRDVLTVPPASVREHGFQTLVRNRTSHGGILAAGSGALKRGENGKGITSRWYPQTLAKRIRDIQQVRDKIVFLHGDGIQVINEHASQQTAAFYMDPPYTAGRNGKRAGSRLYTHYELDHESLFGRAEKIRGQFLMTYDNAEEVRQLAMSHHFSVQAIAMKNTHHARMQELLIGRDLSWA